MNLQQWETLLQRPETRRIGWVAAGTIAAAVILGPDLWSYLRSTTRIIEDKVHTAVPLEFEIERAQTLMDEMMPGIRKEMMQVAEQQVELNELQALVAAESDSVKSDREAIIQMRNDPDNQSGAFKISGQAATPEQMRRDMLRKFSMLKMSEDRLELHRRQLELREREIERQMLQVQAMLKTKDQLQVQLDEISSRLRTLKAEDPIVKTEQKDNVASRCEIAIQTLRNRLDAADRLLKTRENLQQLLEDSYVSAIQHPEAEITSQIDSYFGSTNAKPIESSQTQTGDPKQ